MKYFKISLNEIMRVELLGVAKMIPPAKHVSRYANPYILYAVTKGQLKMKLNGELLVLNAGDIYLFNKGDIQEPAGVGQCEYYYLHFDLDNIELIESGEKEYYNEILAKRNRYVNSNTYSLDCYNNYYVYIRQDNRIEDIQIFDHLIEILKANRITVSSKYPENRLNISANVQNFFMKLEAIDEPKKEKSYYKALEIARYIEQHFKEPISAETIESLFYISFDYANRIFEKNMKFSIIKYRNTVRMNHAKIKLATTNMMMSEIAAEIGFESEQYFSRIFKKYEGITPTAYRKNQLKGQ